MIEPDHHVKAHRLPDRHGHDRPQRGRGIAQPVAPFEGAETERGEQVVQQPIIAVVDEAPQKRDHDDRDHDRHEIDRAVDVDAPQALVDQQREAQGKARLHGRDHQHEEKGVHQGLHEDHVRGDDDPGSVAGVPAEPLAHAAILRELVGARDRADPRILDRAVGVAQDLARVGALGLERDDCKAQQAAVIVEPHVFRGVGRDQPLVRQREVEGKKEGQDDEDRDQAEARQGKAPARAVRCRQFACHRCASPCRAKGPGTSPSPARPASAVVAVALVALDVGLDRVDGGVKLVGHVRAIGDVGQRRLEDLRRDDVARRHRAHERLFAG